MGIDISKLPLPKVSPSGVQLLNALSAEDPDFKKLEIIINKDPTLASSVIKYANSPLYHRQSKISNVKTALGLLGLKNIRSAVVMAIMRSDRAKQNSIDELIWEHSQLVSNLCRLISRVCAPALADDMQFIGLIHDIGMLVLNHYDPGNYQSIIRVAQAHLDPMLGEELSENQGEPLNRYLDLLEEQAFGISHDVVTLRICEHFRFVEQVGIVIGGYHARMSAIEMESLNTDIDKMICILSLAHHLESQITDLAHYFTSTIPFSLEQAIKLLRLDELLVSEILSEYRGTVCDANG